MKNKYRLLGIYLPIYAVVLLSSVIMRIIATLIHFDYRTGYFTNHSLISVSNAIVVAGIILLFSYAVTARKDLKLIPNFTSPMTYIPTGIVGVALIFVAVLMLILARDAFEFTRITGSFASYGFKALLYLACAVFAVCSAVHFSLTATIENRTNASRAAFGLCTVIFLALYAAYIYFDTNLPINAPSKIIDEMAYLFAAVFFLYETRLSLGREKWRAYIAFGFVASLLTAYSAIPSLVVYFAKDSFLSLSIYESLLTLALFLFITARIVITGDLVEDKPSETVATIIDAANERVKEISHEKEDESTYSSDFNENQLTIEDLEKAEAEESAGIEDAAKEDGEPRKSQPHQKNEPSDDSDNEVLEYQETFDLETDAHDTESSASNDVKNAEQIQNT